LCLSLRCVVLLDARFIVSVQCFVFGMPHAMFMHIHCEYFLCGNYVVLVLFSVMHW
jgi:hypothetical protein